MHGLIINCRSSGNPLKLEKMFSEMFGKVDLTDWSRFKEGDQNKYDYIVLSGGSTPFHKVGEVKSMLAKSSLPIIGICFGMQLMCSMFKIPLKRLKNKRVGNKQFTFQEEKLSLYYTHQWYIDFKDINKDEFNLINQTINSDNENITLMIESKVRNWIGIQGHPEYSVQDTRKIFQSYLKKWIYETRNK